jgi:hypothetical protein
MRMCLHMHMCMCMHMSILNVYLCNYVSRAGAVCARECMCYVCLRGMMEAQRCMHVYTYMFMCMSAVRDLVGTQVCTRAYVLVYICVYVWLYEP